MIKIQETIKNSVILYLENKEKYVANNEDDIDFEIVSIVFKKWEGNGLNFHHIVKMKGDASFSHPKCTTNSEFFETNKTMDIKNILNGCGTRESFQNKKILEYIHNNNISYKAKSYINERHNSARVSIIILLTCI